MHNNSQGKKQAVEDHRRSVKLSKNKTYVTACNERLNAKTLNVKSVSAMCDKCGLIDKYDMCVLKFVAKPLKETVASKSNKTPTNFTRKLYKRVSKTCSWWYSKFTPSGYIWKPKSKKENVNLNKFLGTVKFGNDQIAPILGYGDLVQGAVTIKGVYYVEGLNHNLFSVGQFYDADLEVTFRKSTCFIRDLKGNDLLTGLNHNLFSVGQFCDADLEVAFRKSTCFIRDLKGNDLLTSSRGTDLYPITLQSTSSPNLICLMAKATSSQGWLWHRRLSHLNFDTINLLSKNDIVVGLLKLKFIKDHLCSSCELRKAKRKSFHSKLTPSSKRRLHLLHIDLCGPMHVASINGKRYVLVIGDDYSRYTWTYFLRSKDETPEVLIDFLRLVQRGLQAQVRVVRTDKGTEFLNQTLHADGENLDKMKEKGDECIFVGYSNQSRAYRVFNKRTRVIMESIHGNFDELPQMVLAHNSSDPAPTCQKMASVQISSDPTPECQTMALEHDSLCPGRICQENVSHEDKTVTTSNELDLLFSLMFDELLNGSTKVVTKSSVVSAADDPNQRQHLTTPLNNHTTSAPTCQNISITSSVTGSNGRFRLD
uniref:Integrase catalytic domain-containing protein n=1 Tax=Tanacetum cinerariifolium TaxID=118510 RepID=A0A699JL02_TANCI|nr:hypothetical protein [Tanacetum cinerariifolium]